MGLPRYELKVRSIIPNIGLVPITMQEKLFHADQR